MKQLGLILSYYNNAQMFMRQEEEWKKYPDWVQERLAICITDDCSDRLPLSLVLQFPEKIEGKAFRIEKKKPWNWLSCRNIGAHNINAEWLLVTDIDHLVTAENMVSLVTVLDTLNKKYIYTLCRENHAHVTITTHTNSYLMTRDMYWEIGGYDEELAGLYFGTTGTYRARAFKVAAGYGTLDIPLTWFNSGVIPDADTSPNEFPKDKIIDHYVLTQIQHRKNREGRPHDVRVLTYPYSQIHATQN